MHSYPSVICSSGRKPITECPLLKYSPCYILGRWVSKSNFTLSIRTCLSRRIVLGVLTLLLLTFGVGNYASEIAARPDLVAAGSYFLE